MRSSRTFLLRLALLFVVLFCTFEAGICQTFGGVTSVTMKSFNEISVVGTVRNGRDVEITVLDGRAALQLHGKLLAHLSQVGSVTVGALSEQSVEVVLRIDNIDPMQAMTLMSKVTQMDFSGLTADAEGVVRIGALEQRIAHRNIDLTNIISIFAPKE